MSWATRTHCESLRLNRPPTGVMTEDRTSRAQRVYSIADPADGLAMFEAPFRVWIVS